MSNANDIKIILLYENKDKQIKVPEYFEDLEKEFCKEFNKSKNQKYSFNYLDSDDEENNISDESEYKQALDESRSKKRNMKIKIIEIEEKKEECDSEDYEDEEHKKVKREEIDELKSGHNFSLLKEKKEKENKINKEQKKLNNIDEDEEEEN